MLDPSAFTIPYDAHLCHALARAGVRVKLFTRPIRKADYFSKSIRDGAGNAVPSYQTVEHFYNLSERAAFVTRYLPYIGGLKGIEHLLNMTTFCHRMRRAKPDIVHFQWMLVPTFDRLYLRRIRTYACAVLTVHDTNALLSRSSWLQTAGWQSALADFDGLIVHTEAGKRELANHVDRSRIFVVPHGVFDAPSQCDVAMQPHQRSEKLTLLLFGAIKPYKGLDVLIKALALVPPAERKKLHLIVAGNPSMPERELRELASGHGVSDCIEWKLRYIQEEEIPPLLDRSEVIVFPYKEIDASGVLMKMLPYGKAIVASRIGLFDELLTDGIDALLVEPNSPEALAKSLLMLLENCQLAKTLGAQAATLANEVLSWDRIAEKTLAVYQSAIEQNSQRIGAATVGLEVRPN